MTVTWLPAWSGRTLHATLDGQEQGLCGAMTYRPELAAGVTRERLKRALVEAPQCRRCMAVLARARRAETAE